MQFSPANTSSKIVAADFRTPPMTAFVKYIIHIIEHEQIFGRKGWNKHFESYEWPLGRPDCIGGISARKHFHNDITLARNSQGQGIAQLKRDICNAVSRWGGINAQVSAEFTGKIFSTIEILSSSKSADYIDCKNIFGQRIATASKMYYLSDPWAWTIYDSRVAFALNQLSFSFQKSNAAAFEQIQDRILFSVPESKGNNRKSLFNNRWNDRYASQWFIRASLLLREIATALNTHSLPAPQYSINDTEGWALYHVEMVLFMLGKQRWVDQRHYTV
jgi:hypothetical protein